MSVRPTQYAPRMTQQVISIDNLNRKKELFSLVY